MSTTTTPPAPPSTPAENRAVLAAKDIPTLVAGLQAAGSPLADNLIPKALLASKTPWGTIIGTGIGWAVTHYGMACTATQTTACWSQNTIDVVTGAGVLLGTVLGSYVMRYISKSPIGGIVSAAPVPTTAPTS